MPEVDKALSSNGGKRFIYSCQHGKQMRGSLQHAADQRSIHPILLLYRHDHFSRMDVIAAVFALILAVAS